VKNFLKKIKKIRNKGELRDFLFDISIFILSTDGALWAIDIGIKRGKGDLEIAFLSFTATFLFIIFWFYAISSIMKSLEEADGNTEW
jgi:hypothetical protein